MYEQAIRAADRLVKAFHSRDPVRIARELDIEILYRQDFLRQKGAFCMVEGYPFIFLKASLEEDEARMVCAHELGHAMLHRKLAQKGALCEYELFTLTNDVEYEANLFAARLLIDKNEMLEYLKSGMDAAAAARALNVSENLLLLRLEDMNRRGSRYRLPFVPDRGFMGE